MLAFYTQLNAILVASYLPVIFFFKMAIGGAVKCQNWLWWTRFVLFLAPCLVPVYLVEWTAVQLWCLCVLWLYETTVSFLGGWVVLLVIFRSLWFLGCEIWGICSVTEYLWGGELTECLFSPMWGVGWARLVGAVGSPQVTYMWYEVGSIGSPGVFQFRLHVSFLFHNHISIERSM